MDAITRLQALIAKAGMTGSASGLQAQQAALPALSRKEVRIDSGVNPILGTGTNAVETDTSLNEVNASKNKAAIRTLQQQNRTKAIERERGLITSEIDEVYFNMYSTEEIDRRSVKTITSAGHDDTHGVRSPALGPRNSSQICETCSKDFKMCPGHFGKINIPPLMHPLALNWIIDVLSVVCNACGCLQLTEEQIESQGIKRLSGLTRLSRIKAAVKVSGKTVTKCNRLITLGGQQFKCGGTATPVFVGPKDNKEYYKLQYHYPGSKEIMMISPLEIKHIFDLITPEDARLLGFLNNSHPRNLIMERLIVMPYCARPDLHQGEKLLQDDITITYTEIVTCVNAFFNPDGDEADKEEAMTKIHFKISRMMFNHDGKHRQNLKELMDLKKRLQGKNALVRGHIMGKRVNFAGRTVGCAGAENRVDEIGVPRLMANELTRPMTVTNYNREDLQEIYDAGNVRHIRMFKDTSNAHIAVNDLFRKNHPSYLLQIGDVVERDLQDGDWIIINRQPSLHKQSLIALRVKLIEDRVIRINLSITTPLNADFDGDELNLHLPQTIEAYAEVSQLLAIDKILMNDQKNSVMIAITYESLVAAYLLTLSDEMLDILNDSQSKLVDKILSNKVTPKEQKKINAELNDIYIKRQLFLRETVMDSTIFDFLMSPFQNTTQYATLQKRLADQSVNWFTDRALLSVILPAHISYKDNNFDIRNGVVVKAIFDANTYLPFSLTTDPMGQNPNETPMLLHASDVFSVLFPPSYDYQDTKLTVRAGKIVSAVLVEGNLLNDVIFDSALAKVADRPQVKSLKMRLKRHGVPWGSARALFSAALPETFYYNNVNKNDRLKIQNRVVIKDGVLLRGVIEKDAIGVGKGYLMVQMNKQLGGKAVIDFMSDVQFILLEFMALRGLTVGIDDCIPANAGFQRDLDRDIAAMSKKVVEISSNNLPTNTINYSLSGVHRGPAQISSISAEAVDRKITELVNAVKTNAENTMLKYFTIWNSLRVMTESGAKGSLLYATQISSMLGQQKVGGKRIPANLEGGRSLPVYQPYDKTPEARGFCKNSFSTGMSPSEFFFHAQGGREGLIDTAVNTAQTGFLQHQLIKYMEDITTDTLGCVRATNDTIIQPIYGGDGFDPSKLNNVKVAGKSMPFFVDLVQFVEMLNNKFKYIDT